MTTPNGDASAAPVPSSWTRAVTMLGRLAPSAIPTSIGAALAHGAVRSLAVNVAGTGVSFAVQILLARQLGTSHYGVYLYVLAWMNLGVQFAKLELDSCAVRFVGAYGGTGNWSALRGFLSYSTRVVTVASLVLPAVAAAVIWALRARIEPNRASALLAACALVPIGTLIAHAGGILQGFRRVVASQAPSLLLRPILLGVAVLAWASWSRRQLNAADVITLNTITSAAMLVLVGVLAWRAVPVPVRFASPSYERREWMHAALGILGVSTLETILSTKADLLIIGTVLPARDASLYGAASQLASFVSFGVAAVTFIAVPMIAELYAARRHAELQRLVSLVGIGSAVVSIPVVIALVALGRPLLRLYGAEFADAYLVLLVLGVCQTVQALFGIRAGFLLTMTGNQHLAAYIIGSTAAVNVLLTIILTPRYGMIGAAIATTIAFCVRSILLGYFIKARIGVSLLWKGS
jgi:O-antigen/teichoic acid export membrane protein